MGRYSYLFLVLGVVREVEFWNGTFYGEDTVAFLSSSPGFALVQSFPKSLG